MPAAEGATENAEESSSKGSRKERQPLHLQEDPRVRLTRKSARIIDEIQKGDATYAEIIESALHICYESGLFREFHPRGVLALMEELRSAIQAHNAALISCHHLATSVQVMDEDLLICESLDRDLAEFMAKNKAWLAANSQKKSGDGNGATQKAPPAPPARTPQPAQAPKPAQPGATLKLSPGIVSEWAAIVRSAGSCAPPRSSGPAQAGAQRQNPQNPGNAPEIE